MRASEGNKNHLKTRLTRNESESKSNQMAIKSHEIRDPVHGLVKLSEKEMEIELDSFGLSVLRFLKEEIEVSEGKA